jgi:hypothetical protein
VADAADFIDEAGGDWDVAADLALDASFGSDPTGPAADAIEGIRNALMDAGVDGTGGGDNAIGELAARMYESAYDNGGLYASDLEHLVRNSSAMEHAIDYDLSAGQMLNQAYRSAGHDAVDLRNPGVTTFQQMPNLEDTAFHRTFLEPNLVRSRFARFDPRLRHLANLSAGLAGGMMLPFVSEEENALARLEAYLNQ